MKCQLTSRALRVMRTVTLVPEHLARERYRPIRDGAVEIT